MIEKYKMKNGECKMEFTRNLADPPAHPAEVSHNPDHRGG